MEQEILKLARENEERARKIIQETRLVEIWKSVGADPHLVGSLSTGLLMKHLDIDFHIYSSPITLSDSFQAMSRLAENSSIRRIECANLLNTPEECIEWHAWYQDSRRDIWQIDMIHILKGSRYDGYFEEVSRRICNVLTDETKEAILQLKFETPDDEKIMGIEYYQAVIAYNIRTYAQFIKWREEHPVTGIVEWMPEI